MRLVPWRIRHAIDEWRNDRRIARSPDRAVLREKLCPALAGFGPVLWVGCRRYTRSFYPLLEAGGHPCTTLEIDAEAARHGRRGRHVIGSLTEADSLLPEAAFAVIVCNGVFGWGVDSPEAQASALSAMATLLRPGGLLLLGWNLGTIDDPVPLAERWFERATLPGIASHSAVPETTHRYELLRLR